MVMTLTDVPAHVVAPPGVELKQSGVSENETGAWCTEKVSLGNKFGPFIGRTLLEGKAKKVDFRYAWEVYDPLTSKLLHVVDATNPQHGNWMRYVNCARYLEEQNLVSFQEGSQIFYRAIRDISPGEELLTWYSKEEAQAKRKRKDSVKDNPGEANSPVKIRKKPGPKPKIKPPESEQNDKDPQKPLTSPSPKPPRGKPGPKPKKTATLCVKSMQEGGTKKRKLKKALADDFLQGDDFEALVSISKQTLEDGRKEGVVKVKTSVGRGRGRGSSGSGRGGRGGRGAAGNPQSNNSPNSPRGRGRGRGKGQVTPIKKHGKGQSTKAASPVKSPGKGRGRGRGGVKCPSPAKKIKTEKQGGRNNGISDDLWSLMKETASKPSGQSFEGEYYFEILPVHGITGKLDRKLYKCDICSGIYRHAFSLKRHYLRNHIYCYYLSEADISNCKILVRHQEALIKNKPKNLSPKVYKAEVDSNADAELKTDSADHAGSNSEKSTSNKKDRNTLQTRPNPVLYPGLYRCGICHELFDYIEDLKSHTLDHPSVSSEKSFGCDRCDMKFAYRQNLMRHQAVHTGVRPHGCKKCKKSFTTAASLRKHEETHVGKCPRCKHCKAGFTWRAELKRHMQKLHPEYLHHCPYCNKSFIARSAFQRHLTTHEGDVYEQPKDDKPIFSEFPPQSGKKNKSKVTKVKSVNKTMSKKTKDSPRKYKKKQNRNFKFSCVVCKKRFHNYVNMCRHRRLAHPEVPKLEKASERERNIKTEIKSEESETEIEETVIEPGEWLPCDAKFFAGVADNIAYNLCNHIDGGKSSMQNFSSHIRIKDYKSVSDVYEIETSPLTERDRMWTRYNFPAGYAPIMTPEEISDGVVISIKDEPSVYDENELTVKNEIDAEQPSVSSPEKDLKDITNSSVNNAEKTKVPCSTPLLIKIPEYHRCAVCNCVFSNSNSYEWHMQDKHKMDIPVKEEPDSGIADASATTKQDSPDLTASYLDPMLSYGRGITSELDSDDSGSHSPFHNYSEIVFGKNRELNYVCGVCRKDFTCAMDLGFHQYKKHPTIDCTFLEVETGYSIDNLYYPLPQQTGELAEIKKKPLDSRESHSFTCTRCMSHFSTVTRLYIHIINCAPKPKVKKSQTLPGIGNKRQFANQRSPVVKNRFKQEEKKSKLSGLKSLSDKDSGKDKDRVFTGCRHRRVVSGSNLPLVSAMGGRQRGGLLYNPRNHVRRREMTEVLERHQCNGCGCKFQTISLLERHIRKCDQKEKLKSVKPLKRSASGQVSPNSKLTCRYCSRQFTYLKFLLNHYRKFCRVRKDKESKKSLTEEDLKDEDRIKAAALSAANRELERRESSEIALSGEDGEAKRVKRGWPRGMKRKKGRKNHCWTYIKKRKSPDSPASSWQSFEPRTPDPSCRLDFNKLCRESDSIDQERVYDGKSTDVSASPVKVISSDVLNIPKIKTNNKREQSESEHNFSPDSKIPIKKKKMTLLDFKTKSSASENNNFDPCFLPIQKKRRIKVKSSTFSTNSVKTDLPTTMCKNSESSLVKVGNVDKEDFGPSNPSAFASTDKDEKNVYSSKPVVESSTKTDNFEAIKEENCLIQPQLNPLDLSLLSSRSFAADTGASVSTDLYSEVKGDFSEKLGLTAVNSPVKAKKSRNTDLKHVDMLSRHCKSPPLKTLQTPAEEQNSYMVTTKGENTLSCLTADTPEMAHQKVPGEVKVDSEERLAEDLLKFDKSLSSRTEDLPKFDESLPPKTEEFPKLDKSPSPRTVESPKFDNNLSPKMDDLPKFDKSLPPKTDNLPKLDRSMSPSKEPLVESDSSDEDNLALQTFIDRKLKGKSLNLTIGAKSLPAVPKVTKSEGKTSENVHKRKMIQPTLPNMFPKMKCLKPKQQAPKIVKSNPEPPFEELHKMLDALESPEPLGKDEIFPALGSVSSQPSLNENSCSPESVVSR